MSRIWLDNVELSPMGRKLIERYIEIAIENRTANGSLVSDLIAVKKVFTLNYSIVTDEILEQLSGLYRSGGVKIFKKEKADKSVEQYAVKIRPFSRARNLIGNEWYWENISIELEEV